MILSSRPGFIAPVNDQATVCTLRSMSIGLCSRVESLFFREMRSFAGFIIDVEADDLFVRIPLNNLKIEMN